MTHRGITVDALTLVDAEGRVRATLKCDSPSGMPTLRFYDDEFCERLVVRLGNCDNPVISLLRKDGKVAVGVEVRDQHCGIGISNADGNPLVILGDSPESESRIAVFDDDGRAIWTK